MYIIHLLVANCMVYFNDYTLQ